MCFGPCSWATHEKGIAPQILSLQPSGKSAPKFNHNYCLELKEDGNIDMDIVESGLQEWTIKCFLPSRIVLRIFTEIFAGSQRWRVRGPRPLHPLRIPVPGGPVAAAMALVRVEGRIVPSSATYAWTQPRMLSSACVATSSGEYPPFISVDTLPSPRQMSHYVQKMFGADVSLILSPDTLRPKEQEASVFILSLLLKFWVT